MKKDIEGEWDAEGLAKKDAGAYTLRNEIGFPSL